MRRAGHLRLTTAPLRQGPWASAIARATQALSRFNLDFAGDSVESVRVNGREARWTWADEAVSITPRHALRDGQTFAATGRYTATPFVATDNFPLGFFTINGGSVTMRQPNIAHDVDPVNDHPADRASYDISVNVPEGTTAAGNSDLVFRRTRHGRTYSTWFMREPMASELIALAAGELTITTQPKVRGGGTRTSRSAPSGSSRT